MYAAAEAYTEELRRQAQAPPVKSKQMNIENPAVNIPAIGAEADAVWFADELADAWRTAQDEAVVAYHAWRESPGLIEYAVYRAAQDRADQAQDVLAGARPSVTSLRRVGS